MMKCCQNPQCQGIEKVFDTSWAEQELENYHKNGNSKTSRMLLDAIISKGVEGKTLLDIGGGIGGLQFDLFRTGISQAISAEASPAFSRLSRQEAENLGVAGHITYLVGNFVDLAPQIDPVDIVTLDRVICCFDDMPALVGLSVQRAKKLYGLVFPRDTWWIKLGVKGFNIVQWALRSPFRLFAHSTKAVHEIVKKQGLKRVFHHKGVFWQVLLYQR